MRARKTKKHPALARRLRDITVFSSPREPHRGLLRCGSLTLRCALGRAGVTHLKREGDGATPAGRHRLLSLIVRPDRPRPRSAVPIRPHAPERRLVRGQAARPLQLPDPPPLLRRPRDDVARRPPLRHRRRARLEFSPARAGRGSAIFLHLCRPGYGPTAGCIALERGDLTRLLAAAGPRPRFLVAAKPRKLAVG